MTAIFVSFTDATESTINAYFGSPQDPKVWPNQAEIETSDPRWVEYYDSLPDSFKSGVPSPGA